MPSSRLIPITYYNASKEIRLSAYADIIVIEPARLEPILRCIRFGGYPEMVQAMYDSICAGATIEARIGDVTRRFSSEPKRFIRQINHDGVYAEATLLAMGDEKEAQRPNHAIAEAEGVLPLDRQEDVFTRWRTVPYPLRPGRIVFPGTRRSGSSGSRFTQKDFSFGGLL